MWVARDKDGRLGITEEKPSRYTVDAADGPVFWSSDDTGMFINPNLFPDLKWEDDPIEVELVKKGESR
jgi:hypothetical protein